MTDVGRSYSYEESVQAELEQADDTESMQQVEPNQDRPTYKPSSRVLSGV